VLFAAVHESPFGTFRHFLRCDRMSEIGGRADFVAPKLTACAAASAALRYWPRCAAPRRELLDNNQDVAGNGPPSCRQHCYRHRIFVRLQYLEASHSSSAKGINGLSNNRQT
jgi:hypothetical protein